MDLSKINGLSDVEEQVKAFEAEAKKIGGEEEAKRLDYDIATAKRRIAEYEKMATETDNTMDHVQAARHAGTIRELIEEEKKKLEEAEKAKQDFEKKMNSPEKKKEENNLRDQRSAFFTQAAIKLQDNIEVLQLEMQLELKTGDDATKYKKYNDMQDKLANLKKALALCNEQKAAVKAEFEQQVSAINDILKQTYGERTSAGGKDDPAGGKDDPAGGKDDPAGGKDDPAGGKDDPAGGKDDPAGGKDDPKGGKGKGGLPLQIDGANYYDGLSAYDKYLLKKEAYELTEGVAPESLLTKLRIFLPNRALATKAERYLSSGEIKTFEARSGEPATQEETSSAKTQQEQQSQQQSPWHELTDEQRKKLNEEAARLAKENAAKAAGQPKRTVEGPEK